MQQGGFKNNMKIGNREFDTKNHTYIMGILNVTPDSFSDGGKWNDRDKALHRVEEMLSEGMDIVDIGGESNRPGYTVITDQEEIERTAPVIEAIKANFDVPVSLDTYKSQAVRRSHIGVHQRGFHSQIIGGQRPCVFRRRHCDNLIRILTSGRKHPGIILIPQHSYNKNNSFLRKIKS